jgi:myogenesis-regulating glycosidase
LIEIILLDNILKTSWWDGTDSLIIDSTNPSTQIWFTERLYAVRNTSKINSFKFDAGEVGWLPKNFSLIKAKVSPNEYSTNYARMASILGKAI